jgi:hypothetical protein
MVDIVLTASVTAPYKNDKYVKPTRINRPKLQGTSNIQNYWANALLIEIKELLKKGTFVHDRPQQDDPIIPVTCIESS